MIVPAGRRRDQVSQGLSKHDLFTEDLLRRFAITGQDALKDEKSPPVPNDLQNAMNQSSNPGMSGNMPGSGKMDQNRMPGESQMPDEMPETGSRSPASQFLGADPEEDQGDVTANGMILQQEQEKIRQYVGNDFAVQVSANDDGTISAVVTPPNGVPINDPNSLAEGLMQAVRGEFKDIATPAGAESGPTKIIYYPEFMQRVKHP